MRNGFKIFDADTHVRPDAHLLEPTFQQRRLQNSPSLSSTGQKTKKAQSPI